MVYFPAYIYLFLRVIRTVFGTNNPYIRMNPDYFAAEMSGESTSVGEAVRIVDSRRLFEKAMKKVEELNRLVDALIAMRSSRS